MKEEASLPLGALNEAVGGEQLLHHARLSDARPRAVGIRSVPIVMEHARVKTHLEGLGGRRERQRASVKLAR